MLGASAPGREAGRRNARRGVVTLRAARRLGVGAPVARAAALVREGVAFPTRCGNVVRNRGRGARTTLCRPGQSNPGGTSSPAATTARGRPRPGARHAERRRHAAAHRAVPCRPGRDRYRPLRRPGRRRAPGLPSPVERGTAPSQPRLGAGAGAVRPHGEPHLHARAGQRLGLSVGGAGFRSGRQRDRFRGGQGDRTRGDVHGTGTRCRRHGRDRTGPQRVGEAEGGHPRGRTDRNHAARIVPPPDRPPDGRDRGRPPHPALCAARRLCSPGARVPAGGDIRLPGQGHDRSGDVPHGAPVHLGAYHPGGAEADRRPVRGRPWLLAGGHSHSGLRRGASRAGGPGPHHRGARPQRGRSAQLADRSHRQRRRWVA
jgi:hypothetical protein